MTPEEITLKAQSIKEAANLGMNLKEIAFFQTLKDILGVLKRPSEQSDTSETNRLLQQLVEKEAEPVDITISIV